MPHVLSISDVVPAGMIDSILPILQMCGVALGVLLMVVGAFRLFSPDPYSGGLSYVVSGVFIGGGFLLLPRLVDMIAGEEPTPKPSQPATPSPAPSDEPTTAPPAQQPADLTWLFVLLGIIAAALLTVVLVWVLVTVSQKARRNVREGRERVKAELERVQRLTAAWQTFRDRHDELLRKIVHAETDWDSLFFRPALTDPSVDQTHRMLLAMRAANTLRDTAGDLPPGLASDVDLSTFPYPRAVENFAHAWDIAERHARRVGQKNVPPAERKAIKEIRTLLDIAENGAASQTERNLAYRRAQNLIADLNSIHVPQTLMAQLEESHRLMLTAAQPAGGNS